MSAYFRVPTYVPCERIGFNLVRTYLFSLFRRAERVYRIHDKGALNAQHASIRAIDALHRSVCKPHEVHVHREGVLKHRNEEWCAMVVFCSYEDIDTGAGKEIFDDLTVLAIHQGDAADVLPSGQLRRLRSVSHRFGNLCMCALRAGGGKQEYEKNWARTYRALEKKREMGGTRHRTWR